MNKLKNKLIAGLGLVAALPASAVISLDFTDFNTVPEVAAPAGQVVGNVYRSSNVYSFDGTDFDALFEITGTSAGHNLSSLITFVDVEAPSPSLQPRGTAARLRVNKNGISDNIFAFIKISFVDSTDALNTPVDLPTLVGDNFIVQFDDLDSDVSRNRSDGAGMLTSQIDIVDTAPNTILRVEENTLVAGYTIGLLEDPFTPKGNVVSTTPAAQSPVTIAFSSVSTTINLVLGVFGPETNGNRHIDIDMLPKFEIIPEPSAYAMLAGLLVLSAAAARRRR